MFGKTSVSIRRICFFVIVATIVGVACIQASPAVDSRARDDQAIETPPGASSTAVAANPTITLLLSPPAESTSAVMPPTFSSQIPTPELSPVATSVSGIRGVILLTYLMEPEDERTRKFLTIDLAQQTSNTWSPELPGSLIDYALSPSYSHLLLVNENNGRVEFWITEVARWNPRLVSAAENVVINRSDDYISVVRWQSERYVLLTNGLLDYSGNFAPEQTIILDLETTSFTTLEPGIDSSCEIDSSPRSGHLASWCPIIKLEPLQDRIIFRFAPVTEYVVFETEEPFWIADTYPATESFRSAFPEKPIWSRDLSHIAFTRYIVDERGHEIIYVAAVETLSLEMIYDEDTGNYLAALAWSPAQSYLSFHTNDCRHSRTANYCHKILDTTAPNNLVWDSSTLGIETQFDLVWSPDETLVAVRVTEPSEPHKILIVDFKTNTIVYQFDIDRAQVILLGWHDN